MWKNDFMVTKEAIGYEVGSTHEVKHRFGDVSLSDEHDASRSFIMRPPDTLLPI